MTNLEKWQQKLSEAKDGFELLDVIDEMNMAHADMCYGVEINSCNEHADCGDCKARWLNEEVKE